MNQETAQNRKKVLFVVTKSNLGGAQRYVFDIATNLSSDYEPIALCGAAQDAESAGPLIGMLEQAGVRTIYVPSMNRDVRLVSDARTLWSLVRIMRAERPDIVHLNSSKAGGLGALAARLSGVRRIVFTSHGLAYDEPRFFAVRGLIAIASWLTFLLSHIVICISRDTAARAAALPFCGRRVRLVYNAIRVPDFLPREEARAELLRLAPDAPRDAAWIGTISELVPNKGVPFALRACEQLRQSGKKFVFFVIGSGEMKDALAAAIQKKGLSRHVKLVGYVARASRLLKAFDIFSLSSRKEGLPYVLLEAGYASLPVVGTDIPGIRDIVEDGVSGALCPPRDAERYADSLGELIEDPALRGHFGGALRARVEREFSYEKMMREIVAAYA